MKSLAVALALMALSPAYAQGFFKKPAPAETPAAPATNPQPAPPTAAPAQAPAVKPVPQRTAPPAAIAEQPQPKAVVRPKPQQRAVAPKPPQQPVVSDAPPHPVERPAAAQRPAPPQPVQPAATQNAAAKGMVDPVQECAGGWGIKQAFCRSIQCQRSESFHHPVCVDMRAEQAARQQNTGGGGQ